MVSCRRGFVSSAQSDETRRHPCDTPKRRTVRREE
jgi:hypothetical protein